MMRILSISTAVALFFFLYGCNRSRNITKKNEIELSLEDNKEWWSIDQNAWEEANKFRNVITDTTFLQTRGLMSNSAIDPLTGGGWNMDYAFNQVVYIKALERVKKHFSVKDNQLICNLKSGAEVKMSEDLYQYIINVISIWNAGVKDGKYKIIKTGKKGYDISPVAEEFH